MTWSPPGRPHLLIPTPAVRVYQYINFGRMHSIRSSDGTHRLHCAPWRERCLWNADADSGSLQWGLRFTFLIYSQVVLLVQRHTMSIKILADSWALLAKPKSQEVGAGLRVPPRGPTGPDVAPTQ